MARLCPKARLVGAYTAFATANQDDDVAVNNDLPNLEHLLAYPVFTCKRAAGRLGARLAPAGPVKLHECFHSLLALLLNER